ncbi:DUF6705 family protein [Tenacibaculum sp. 190524A05c]|uniref:DUF6705 family protein n=1 Tax=Tenacibaculum platacis TaxID=3137852 RepID=UPI0032B2649F
MKKNITLLFIILISISCKSQIITIENLVDYNSDLPEGAYIKDVNNVLNKYEGVWKGVLDNKTYEFRIIKKTQEYLEERFKEDLLLMRYKITNAKGVVIENTLSLPDNDVMTVSGRYLTKSGGYLLRYIGRGNCGQNGNIYISVYDSQNKKMELSLQVDGEFYSDNCIQEDEQIIPRKINLTKQ